MREPVALNLIVRTGASVPRSAPAWMQTLRLIWRLILRLMFRMMLLSAALAGPAAPSHAATYAEPLPGSPSAPDFAQQVLALINAYRSTLGLWPVQTDPALLLIAEASSREQAAAGWLSHSGFSQRFAQAGRGTCVENLAAGRLQPPALVAAWQASPAHRHSLVAPAIRYAGLSNVNGYITFFACD